MSTYLRRVVVLEQYAPEVVNYINANVTSHVITDTIKINKRDYRIIRFVSNTPFIMRVGNIQVSRKGTKPVPKNFIERVVASDADLGSLVVDPTDYASLSVAAAGTFNITMTITDPDGVAATLEFPVVVVDSTIPVITLTATSVDVPAASVAAWTPATNIASAVDDGDNVSASVTFTYKQDDANGTEIADLAAARTHLGTLANKVYVAYDYSDASANAAVQKTATFTAVA